MDNDSRFFITTAIDYPNSRPHIGTAFEKIGADVQARFRRMEGDRVHFLMGNDENTIKVPQRAASWASTPSSTSTRWPASFRKSGVPSTSRTTISSRPAKSGTTSGAGSSSRRFSTRATSTRASIPATTAPAAKRSRPRRKWKRGADAAPTTPARRSPGSKRRITSSGSRPIATDCWRITRLTPNSSSPRAGATRSSTWLNPSSRTSPSLAKGLIGASRSPSIRRRRFTSGSTRS